MFIIEKLWIDNFENHPSGAIGYSIFSYVDTEDEAKSIVKKGGTVSKTKCWAMLNDMPLYKYKKINKYEF